MVKYRKKPVVVDAVQWFPGTVTFLGVCHLSCYPYDGDDAPHVHTIHNNQPMRVEPGDWIIPEMNGTHYYPCKPDIFEATYEPA